MVGVAGVVDAGAVVGAAADAGVVVDDVAERPHAAAGAAAALVHGAPFLPAEVHLSKVEDHLS